MVTGDFNHDGRVDFATANFGSGQGQTDGSISVVLNNGSGGFVSPTSITSGINPRSIVTGDFNKDGNADVAVLHYVNGSCCISTFATVFLSNAAGVFSAAGAPVPVGNDAPSVAVGDFNKDTNPDLVAVSPTSGVILLLGNGSGAFSAPQLFGGVGSPQSVAVGDVNGDTKLDVIAGGTFGFNLSVLLGDGSGGFGAPTSVSTGAFVVSIALGDFNEDSKLDVATVTTESSVRVLLGNGNGTFTAATAFPVTSLSQSLLVRDLNGDGHLDFAVSSSGLGTISILLGNGLGSFGSLKSYVAGAGSFFAAGEDFNGDTQVDLAITNASANNVSVLPGDGLGAFAGARVFTAGLSPLNIAGGDLNGDGKNDLVVANFADGAISVLINAGNESFLPQVKFPANASSSDVVLADFNQDGKLDVATANFNSTNVLIGNGNGSFGPATTVLNNTNAWALTSADFNKDGKADLAVANNSEQSLSLLFGNGTGSFSSPTNVPLSAFPTDITNADVNGDGNTDLIVADGVVAILLGDGTGTFSAADPLLAFGAQSVAVGDVNGDGSADVLATRPVSNQLSLFLGNGNGGFHPEVTFPVFAPTTVAFGDFNDDGKTDLAASSGDSALVIFQGDGTGMFASPVSFAAGSNPRGFLPVELNGDGKSDVAIANSSGYVSVLFNTCNATPATVPQLSISDVSLAEGDNGSTNALFTVSLSAQTKQTVTVSYYSVDSTATSGSDYQPVVGRLTFIPGLTAQTISVPVNGDTVAETDEGFNVFLHSPLNALVNKAKGSATIINDDGMITFSSPTYSVTENGGSQTIEVVRSGNLAGEAMVDYATSDTAGGAPCNTVSGAASSRCDYLRVLGRLTFAAGENSKSISIPIVDDAFAEGAETFLITLSNSRGASIGPSNAIVTINDNDSSLGTNPIDDVSFFVRQHYIDFLNREPDTDGLNFWINTISSCGMDAQCAEVKRINASAAFFLSIEFQETGYLVYRTYKSAFDFFPGTTVPVGLTDFLRDTQQIGQGVRVGSGNWEAQLEANKQAYFRAFVTRPDFLLAFPTSMSATDFVTQLNLRSGGVLSAPERAALIDILVTDPMDVTKRAQVLRAVAEDDNLKTAEFNRAFVLMQYFGYLRRNPNDLPDLDFSGYNFWLTKLNDFNGNFVQAEMVKAFLNSKEYRERFGP